MPCTKACRVQLPWHLLTLVFHVCGRVEQGGSATGAFQYVQENGIPDSTCQQYKAIDQDCTAENICRNCVPWGCVLRRFVVACAKLTCYVPGSCDDSTSSSNCFAVKDFTKYTIEEYGKVSTAPNMQIELFTRGPIACGVDAGPFES